MQAPLIPVDTNVYETRFLNLFSLIRECASASLAGSSEESIAYYQRLLMVGQELSNFNLAVDSDEKLLSIILTAYLLNKTCCWLSNVDDTVVNPFLKNTATYQELFEHAEGIEKLQDYLRFFRFLKDPAIDEQLRLNQRSRNKHEVLPQEDFEDLKKVMNIRWAYLDPSVIARKSSEVSSCCLQ